MRAASRRQTVFRHAGRTRGALALALALAAFWPRVAAASTPLDLVHLAQAHELAHEDDVALRRYMEALSLDPMCEEAYLGLGRLRARHGDLREAERVYSVALEHMPQLRQARTARAYLRHALGATPEAVADLVTGYEDDVATLRVLASWYAEDGQVPAQLSVWRRILGRAEVLHDVTLLHEARTMVRALVIFVGPADPAATPLELRDVRDVRDVRDARERGLRGTLSVLARRGS